MKSNRRVLSVLPILALAVCLQAPSLAAAGKARPLAEVTADSAHVTFQPLVAYSQVRVTVAGPGGFESAATFGAGETLAVELPGTDGLYKYELRFAPVLDREDRELLTAARAAGTDLGAGAADENRVQSGSFTLAAGSLVLNDLVEESDKVVLTGADGVIRNSLCVGSDCPNSPAFGDSTILMMENNTRIKFGDTSNSPFPNRDWEIEANSSSSGGASYLGFNDCGTADNDGGCTTDLVFAVEAGARQSALYVESDGDIGIGTSNPAVDLHVVTGNSPTLRLDQDGSSGFTPQVWDVAGNETNFFVRDATNGSQLPFRIRPDAPSNSIFIDVDGDVGFGTASPDFKVDIEADGPGFRLSNTGAAGNSWDVFMNGTTGRFNFRDNGTGNVPFKVEDGSNENLFRVGINTAGSSSAGVVSIGSTGVGGDATLQVQGSIEVDGGVVHADYVFEPDYDLPSIADNAAFMWQRKHLPSLPKAPEGGKGPVNLVAHQMGVLEELEKAHIYIEQLHERLARLEALLASGASE